MEVMEEFVAQHTLPHLMGNRGLIPDRSSDHSRHDVQQLVAAPGLWLAIWRAGGPSPQEMLRAHIPEKVRRKLARCLRQALLLVESFIDESETNEEPDQSKKRQNTLKSVRSELLIQL